MQTSVADMNINTINKKTEWKYKYKEKTAQNKELNQR